MRNRLAVFLLASVCIVLSAAKVGAFRFYDLRPVPSNPIAYGQSASLHIFVEAFVEPIIVYKPAEVLSSSNFHTIKLYLTHPDFIRPIHSGHTEVVSLGVLPVGIQKFEVQIFADPRTNIVYTNAFGSFWALPKLSYSQEPSSYRVSWPVASSNFVLQTAAQIDSATSWSDWELPVYTVGTNLVVTNDLAAGMRVFRLRQAP